MSSRKKMLDELPEWPPKKERATDGLYRVQRERTVVIHEYVDVFATDRAAAITKANTFASWWSGGRDEGAWSRGDVIAESLNDE